MVILLSNDDGVNAVGLNILRKELLSIGDVWVVAPDRERSAASHSLTLHRPLKAVEIEPKIFAIDGTPTDAVILGVNKFLPTRPDVVVSGINEGPNLGDDITYSGTVSAAMEGTILGIPSIALSLDISGFRNYRAAAKAAVKIVKWVYEFGLPEGVLLNVNFPDVEEYEDYKGIKWTRQGRRIYTDYISELRDPRGNVYYWIGGLPTEDENLNINDDTDIKAVKEGFISITPIKLDFTDYDFLKRVKDIQIGL